MCRSIWLPALILITGTWVTLPQPKPSKGEAQSVSNTSSKSPQALAYEMTSLTGEKVNLAQKYGNRVVLIVNVASRCGLTPQYKELQALHKMYAEQGLAVVGFPCNQFGRQEPGSSEEIQGFCKKNYGVEFDMFEKRQTQGVRGA